MFEHFLRGEEMSKEWKEAYITNKQQILEDEGISTVTQLCNGDVAVVDDQ